MNNTVSGGKVNPGKYLTFYLFGTLVSWFFSPFSKVAIENFLTFFYVALVWSAFYIGYLNGNRSPRNFIFFREFKNKNKIVLTLSLYCIILVWLTLYEYGWVVDFNQVVLNIISPGESYFKKFEINKEWGDSTSFIGQIYTISAGCLALLIPLGVFYWRELNFFVKLTFIVAFISKLAPSLLSGTMADLALVIIELSSSLFCLVAIGYFSNKQKNIAYFGLSVSFVLFFSFAIYSQIARADHMGWTPWIGGDNGRYDQYNLVSLIFGDRLGFGINVLLSYVNQGYDGVMQCLMLDDWGWTFGIGHSRALMEYADQYLGWSWIWDEHLLWKNQVVNGRDPLMYWSTAIPWFASDVSFIGVPFVIYYLGKLFGKTWREAVFSRNPIALALFSRLMIFAVFLPGNNQIFQGRVLWWGTVELMFIYWVFRKGVTNNSNGK